MTYSRIVGTGSYLPKKILSNHDLAERLETSHDWIVERTGIVQRHIAEPEETTTFMAVEAAKKAMAAAQISKEDIALIIVATTTSEKVFPATACLLQNALGIPACPAFDVQAACSGFIYALSIADKYVKTGAAEYALVVGAESMSRIVNWEDRRTCVLFGDGAGACVLRRDKVAGILSTLISADGKHQDILFLDKHPDAAIHMDGNTVFRLAVNMLDSVAAKTIASADLQVSDIDWLVPHQANLRIIQATSEKLGIPMERVIVTVHNHGNTSAASIPLALDAAVKEGRIMSGQHLLLEAIGGGLTWGTALLRY